MKLTFVRLSAVAVSCISLLLLVLVGPLAPGRALAQELRDLRELASFEGPDRLKRLVDGANREGMLNLYTSMTAPTAAS